MPGSDRRRGTDRDEFPFFDDQDEKRRRRRKNNSEAARKHQSAGRARRPRYDEELDWDEELGEDEWSTGADLDDLDWDSLDDEENDDAADVDR